MIRSIHLPWSNPYSIYEQSTSISRFSPSAWRGPSNGNVVLWANSIKWNLSQWGSKGLLRSTWYHKYPWQHPYRRRSTPSSNQADPIALKMLDHCLWHVNTMPSSHLTTQKALHTKKLLLHWKGSSRKMSSSLGWERRQSICNSNGNHEWSCHTSTISYWS